MAEIGTYSEVAVCNMALQLIGRGSFIVTMDEDSQAARIMRHQLPYARDATLRAYPWNFAQARAEVAALATAPAFEYDAQYQLPADCLWLHTVYEANDREWCVEGGLLLANVGNPAYIKYTKLITDLKSADPLFIQTLAARLASDCAMTLTESIDKSRALLQAYQLKLREARAVDAQEGQCESLPAGSWHDSRLNGGFAPYNDWGG